MCKYRRSLGYERRLDCSQRQLGRSRASSHGPRQTHVGPRMQNRCLWLERSITSSQSIQTYTNTLTTHKLTWHRADGGGSKKSKAGTREGRGFCVCGVSYLITGETSNRPRRSFEARERPPLWLPLMSDPIFWLQAISWIKIVFVGQESNHPRIVYQRADVLITASHFA